MAVIYRPAHERQIKPSDRNGRYNCAAVAAAIAMDRATLGGVMVNGEDVRARTNEPVPDPKSPGLNIPQLVAAAKTFEIELTPYSGGAFTRVLSFLRQGRGVIISGEGDALGRYICQPGFVLGHSLYLNNLNTPGTSILVYNPLCSVYRWLPTRSVEEYATSFSVGLRYAVTRATPNIDPKYQVN